jgi:deazaflavin-dependent oxidoreductase (nitroreductase family)
MSNWQWFGKVHTSLYHATGGILGGRLPGLALLLLTTRGRKSGLRRTSPLPYLKDAEDWVIVGSNNGLPRDPAWWLNLQSEPRAEIQLMADHVDVEARLADSKERARLWPALVEYNPRYADYAEKTSREIPVVILSRSTDSG